jgi:hypothetical protein
MAIQGTRSFIFLEFTNPKVRNFLADLRHGLSEHHDPGAVHITIRGPYRQAPRSSLLEELDDEIRNYGVVVTGVGTFAFERQFVVYLKAQSPVFDRVWWKPDFPKKEFGIHPHVSMFHTTNSRIAHAAEAFLRAERIEIFTLALRLVVHSVRQPSLFDIDLDATTRGNLSSLERINFKPGILVRAKNFRDSLSP